MGNLVQNTEARGYRARADRCLQSGRVISVDSVYRTAILDVGMVNALGSAVYLEDVPFTPQNPPALQDTVNIMRTNSSPYSHVIGAGAVLGGANSGQVVGGTGGSSSESAPTKRGQILYSLDGAAWTPQTPVVSSTGVILTEDATGYIIVAG